MSYEQMIDNGSSHASGNSVCIGFVVSAQSAINVGMNIPVSSSWQLRLASQKWNKPCLPFLA